MMSPRPVKLFPFKSFKPNILKQGIYRFQFSKDFERIYLQLGISWPVPRRTILRILSSRF